MKPCSKTIEKTMMPSTVSLIRCPPPSLANKLMRGAWQIAYYMAFRFTPVPLHAWRRFILRLFGANIGHKCAIYPSARIWAPWNLIVHGRVTIGPLVNLYNVAAVELADDVIVSQGSHLCTATHDHQSGDFSLMKGPIRVGPNAWIAAEAFVAPGVVIGRSAVVGARSMVTRSVDDFSIVAGNPAKIIGTRLSTARNVLSRSPESHIFVKACALSHSGKPS